MSLARLYHAHHSAQSDDLPFWMELAREHGGPILELGCGTGRVLIPLARAGFAVMGLDNDAEMLACLAEQRAAAGLSSEQAPVLQADMADFSLEQRFQLIILPCNTLSTLSAEQRATTLACAVKHLRRGGIFAASLPNPVIFHELPRRGAEELEDTLIHPQSGNPVQVLSSWERTRTHFTVTWHYDTLLPDGNVQRATMKARHSLAPAEDYVRALDAAGFEIQAIYGDFERQAYTPEAESLIFVTRVG
jgi:SAM-dependent methyltransferase